MSESRYTFLVQGSAAEPYEIMILLKGDDFRARCTCPAGEKKQLCKHVLGIINFSTISSVSARPQIISDNEADAATLYGLFVGSKASDAMNALDEAEAALRQKEAELKKLLIPLKDAVSDRKHALQRILLG